ncbi:hypothetical protein [Methanosarcina sp. DH2]|nr:hypothetical protein [Methanosarcina sp. DH2]
MSGAERSEKDLVLPTRNSGSETRAAKLGQRNSGEAQFGHEKYSTLKS